MDKSYWEENSKFQAAYNELFHKLVPVSGKCDTLEGELLRAASRMYYDYYNNGNMNNTSGANSFLSKFFPNQTEQFKEDLAAHYRECNLGTYTEENLELPLERIVDAVIEFILNQKEYTPNTKDLFDYQEDDYQGDDYDPFCDDEDDY